MLKLAQALVSDDPLHLYMHGELAVDEAARNIRRQAWLAGREPQVMFDILHDRFQAQMAAEEAGDHHATEGGPRVVQHQGGERGDLGRGGSPRCSATSTIRCSHPPVGGKEAIDYSAGGLNRISDLADEVNRQAKAGDRGIDAQPGLTVKQTRHMDATAANDAATAGAGLDGRVSAALTTVLRLDDDQADHVRDTVRAHLSTLPITLTVKGADWFGTGFPDAATGGNIYKPGAARKQEKSYASLFGKKKAEGSIKHLGEFDDKTGQGRGKNYNRFRAFKDQRMTGNREMSDAELPVFAAVNVNWPAYGSQGADADNYGVNSYGDVHFVLDPAAIASRCVYTATDHGQPRRSPYLAFADFLLGGAGITGLKDTKIEKMVKHIVNSATLGKAVASTTQPFEVQVFGQIDILTHVAKIYVAPSVADPIKDNLRAFATTYGKPADWIQFIAAPPEAIAEESWFVPLPMSKGKNLVEELSAKLEAERLGAITL